MTAKEMFEKLNWSIIPWDERVVVYRHDYEGAMIFFYINEIGDKIIKPELRGGYLDLTAEELKACYQQCQELGWLE